MSSQEQALRLAAASPAAELQMRAAIGAHTRNAADIIAELCANPDLDETVAAWLAERWEEHELGAGVAARHTIDMTAPALQRVLDRTGGPLGPVAVARTPWISSRTLVAEIATCDDTELPLVTEVLSQSFNRPDDTADEAAATASALWERWERWYRGSRGGEWVLAAPLMHHIGTALRETGRDWYPRPEDDLGVVGLTNWWSELAFATPSHLVGSYDALAHPSCDRELAVRILTGICEYTGASSAEATFCAGALVHTQAHPRGGAGNVAAAFDTLTAGGDDAGREFLAARLTRTIGADFLVELDCTTAWALSNHPTHRHDVRRQLATVLTERCGDDAEAAISVLVGGFSGTIAELCDIIATGDIGTHSLPVGTLETWASWASAS